ncbi:hypothetical protein OF83DRAFT_1071913 [Amylostereum chailletii]|nr:hypothetical protein OF83DRAFT_1071913 [Amylostereum chailletii]
MSRSWNPELGKKDTIHNGTAATFVELEDCDIHKAFDVEALAAAKRDERRRGLTLAKLRGQIKWDKLGAVMALHCLNILVDAVPCLAEHRETILRHIRTTHAMHRMPDGRKTKIHPMATSSYNEGNTGENANVLDDLLLRQLDLPKEEVARLLVIVGGDQSTVEKLRTLQKFLADCPHGYQRYGWVLPLIQLWHMGWADLERILATHWGISHSDLTSFVAMNNIFGRKVTNSKRPDYYPAQHLVFDTLMAAIIDCWRTHLGVKDLDAYFASHPTTDPPVTQDANTVPPGERSPFIGDQVLANEVLRMRDSMWHYVFQWAISDGDIGHAMNVMAIWTFTFMGCGKTKYTNELLELACNFLMEYSPELCLAIMNNWLCNLTGNIGCHFPMDLLQEKNIKRLKQMSQRRDASFGGDFFKNIVALNIRAFLLSTQSMKSAVQLGAKSEVHRSKRCAAALNEGSKKMAAAQIHKFCEGRSAGRRAQDDFATGFQKFKSGTRIQDFIERTIRDAGDLHGADATDVAVDDAVERAEGENSQGVLPNMIVDGVLVAADDWDDDEQDTNDDINIFGAEAISSSEESSSSDED